MGDGMRYRIEWLLGANRFLYSGFRVPGVQENTAEPLHALISH